MPSYRCKVDNPFIRKWDSPFRGDFCYGSVVSFNMIYASQLLIGWLLFGWLILNNQQCLSRENSSKSSINKHHKSLTEAEIDRCWRHISLRWISDLDLFGQYYTPEKWRQELEKRPLGKTKHSKHLCIIRRRFSNGIFWGVFFTTCIWHRN